MLGSMSKKRNQEEKGKDPLNKTTSNLTHINRGVELLLRKRRKKTVPKTFQVRFGKLLSFFSREVELYFNFYLDFRKKDPGE
jgi:hypothetical protein